MLNKSILIIDDDVLNRKVLEIQLEKEFVSIYKAEDKESALNILDKHKIDLIICDLILGNINGIDVLKQLNINFNLVPVIILSGYKDEEYIEQAKNIGCLDFLFKPINKDDLLKSINSAFSGISHKTNQDKKNSEFDNIVDLKALKRIIGPHMDVLHECFEDFLKIIPDKMTAISSLIEEKNMDSLYKALHSLKNSLKFLTFEKAASVATLLEKKTNNDNILEIKSLYKELENEMFKIEKFIKNFLKENK